ncbi:MAG: GTP cyclohydrolase I FolE [Actinomycetia bacterium]|nr:GTP cyclohydrolase I FolE [Actinomycetes bacterium]
MPIDADKITAGVRLILEGIGDDPDREGLRKTPERVAHFYEEVCAGQWQSPADPLSVTFDEGHQEMVLVRDIPLYSLCEHHLLPFFGVAHVAYIPGPDGRVCGLSKIARVVEVFARRLQVQERLTSQVAESLVQYLHPAGVLVVVEAEHLCMSMRGVKKSGSKTVTSAVRGIFQTDARTRAEAMALIGPR